MTSAEIDFGDVLSAFICDPETTARARPHLRFAARAMADTLACIAAGADAAAPRVVYDALRGLGTGSTSVVGREPLPLLEAVLVNATAAHALDFDDTIQGLTTHPSCHLVPALLALEKATTPTGAQLLTSYLVGLQVEHYLADAAGRDYYRRGWHTTGTVGTVATAAAAAHLLGLNVAQTRVALAAAASSAAGLRANFGTMVKPLHAGHAARGGVEAALLAQAGLTATRDALGHRFGFFAAALGEVPKTVNVELQDFPVTRRLAFKPYPCCGEATGAVQAAIALGTRLPMQLDGKVEVRLSRFAREILEFDAPRTADEARFSATYCVWSALTTGGLPATAFDESAVAKMDVDRLPLMFEVIVDESLEHERAAEVSVISAGERLSERVDIPRGDPSVGFGEDDARRKFIACVPSDAEGQAGPLLDDLLDLDRADRVGDLLGRLI